MRRRTLVVIGKVSEDDLTKALQWFSANQLEPVVNPVRANDFLLDEPRLFDYYATPEQLYGRAQGEPSGEALKDMAAEHLRQFIFPVAALVMDDETWAVWNDDQYTHVRQVLVNEQPWAIWVVRANGAVEYMSNKCINQV